jgi:hypothetical protein
MQCTFSIVLAAALSTQAAAEQTKEEKAKIDAARAQLAVLDKAVQAYYLKNDKFPETLKTLVDDKFLEASSILDPWDKKYHYEVDGKHNGKKKPDIWTVAPDKKTIGNWPEEKK